MFALILLIGSRASVPADEVTALPGWSGALPSKHYSGYLPVGSTSGKPGKIHYWLILAEAPVDPAKAPLVYWTNGGPGSSGISAGLLTELGQFQLNEDSTSNKSGSVPQLSSRCRVVSSLAGEVRLDAVPQTFAE